MHRAPGPFLAVQPTVDLAKRLSQQRIDPLIEESPDLRALVLAIALAGQPGIRSSGNVSPAAS